MCSVTAKNRRPPVQILSATLFITSLCTFLSSAALADSTQGQQLPVVQISSHEENPFHPTVEKNGAHPNSPPLKVILDSTRALPVTISLSRECSLGDADIILLEAGWSNTTSVRLSLESLLPEDTFAASVTVSVVELKSRGTTTKFSLPPYKGIRPMGLFICKDSNNEGRCRDKPVQRSDDIFARYNPKNSPEKLDPKKDITDKSYFFGNVLAYEDRVEFVQKQFTEQTAKQLSLTLATAKVAEAGKIVSRIKHLHSTLGSLPLNVQNSGIEITLPSLDLSGCSK